jgi:multidrug efflux pump
MRCSRIMPTACRSSCNGCKDVGKVDLLGLQDEKIWIELSNVKLATLGLPLAAVQQALEEQNAVSTAGFFETGSERLQLRVSGNFQTVDEIKNFPIRVGDRTFRISDVADVRRGFNDPPAPRMRFMAQTRLVWRWR